MVVDVVTVQSLVRTKKSKEDLKKATFYKQRTPQEFVNFMFIHAEIVFHINNRKYFRTKRLINLKGTLMQI